MEYFEIPFPIRRSSQKTDGFTLVEMSIVVLIAGLILVGAIAIALPIIRTAARVQTDAKLANIAKAIDFYATQNYRVPCPAVPDTATAAPPFGYEAGSGANGDTVPVNCGANPAGWEGIVPFKTLNIPSDWVRDAWGNYITYAISPNFSYNVSDANNPVITAINVHARCRTSDWFYSAIVYEHGIPGQPDFFVYIPGTSLPAPNVLLPKNEKKARFCCSGAQPEMTDLIIDDVNGNPQLAARQSVADINPISGGGTGYAAPDVTFPNPMASNVQVPDGDRATAPVYVLVSHGPNGYGAYNINTGVRNPIASPPATLAELANAGGGRTFYEIPPIDRTNNNPADLEMNFDDVVLWRSQDMIFASQGKSCSLP